MIEVFKTNVDDKGRSQVLIALLRHLYPVCRVNFDLEDCDRVLRIEGHGFCPDRVMQLMRLQGHQCEYLFSY